MNGADPIRPHPSEFMTLLWDNSEASLSFFFFTLQSMLRILFATPALGMVDSL
jgi:hypothetical protein